MSIHAPREGRDVKTERAMNGILRFQSTRPARGATSYFAYYLSFEKISIHAPREGRDLLPFIDRGCRRYFNPRAPRGARQQLRRMDEKGVPFQSTRPARGATARWMSTW